MQYSFYLKSLVLLLIISASVLAISTVQENTYEPVIREVYLSNIEKSTSGITDVWPFDTVIINLDPDLFNESASKGEIILQLPEDN